MEEEIQIEEILLEAGAHGLRQEVVDWAIKEIEEGTPTLQAYIYAYQEWIK